MGFGHMPHDIVGILKRKMAFKNQNNRSGDRRPQMRPVGYGMWIYGLLFLLIVGWSWQIGRASCRERVF